MLSEHDAIVRWRSLFRNGDIEQKTITAAQQVLKQLPQESPVRFRLATELKEIRGLRRRRQKMLDDGECCGSGLISSLTERLDN